MTKSIIGTLFIASVSVAALAWSFGVVELVATALMRTFVFYIGKKVVDFEERVSLITDNVITSRIFETDSGKFKFVDSQKCVFREKIQLFSFRIHTPFSLKGCVEFKNGTAKIEGRLPVGATLFFCMWLVRWATGCIGASIQGEGSMLSLLMLLFGWGVAALMYFPSVALERKRLLVVYDEMKQHLRN